MLKNKFWRAFESIYPSSPYSVPLSASCLGLSSLLPQVHDRQNFKQINGYGLSLLLWWIFYRWERQHREKKYFRLHWDLISLIKNTLSYLYTFITLHSIYFSSQCILPFSQTIFFTLYPLHIIQTMSPHSSILTKSITCYSKDGEGIKRQHPCSHHHIHSSFCI